MDLFNAYLVQATIQSMTPILLAAMCGVLCARVGVFNMAIEGQILVAAFCAVAGSYYFHSAAMGILIAVSASAIFSAILAFGATTLRGDVVIIALAMNLFAGGLTSYLLQTVFHVTGAFSDPGIVGLSKFRALWMRSVPLLGTVAWGQTAITYLSWGLVAMISWVLFLTPLGLRVRGVGEDADAAETLGVRADVIRQGTVVFAGALTGLAGAQLSLGTVTVFSENMSAGRGWIALVAVMLGRYNPLGAAAACILFAFADATGLRLQSRGLPNQLTDIAPYVVTLVALAISHRGKGVGFGRGSQS
jgi:simple sugar transport system permease protein